MKTLIIAFTFLLPLLACKTLNPKSSLKHDIDKPVTMNSPFFWTAPTIDEFYTTLATPFVKPSANDILADSDPLTLRLQSWADELDAHLRDRYPDLMKPALKPIVKIVRSENVNAFVAPVKMCFDNVRVSLNGAVANAFSGTPTVAFYERGTIKAETKCRHVAATAAQIQAYVDHINEKDKICQLGLENSGADHFTIKPAKGCLIAYSLNDQVSQNPQTTFTYMAYAASQYITLYTGLLQNMGEEAAVASLFHEMGHYYNGHAAFDNGDYNYLYKLAATNSEGAPRIDDAMKKLNLDRADINRRLAWLDAKNQTLKESLARGIYPVISGQKVHSMFFYPFRDLARRKDIEFCKNETTYATECQACRGLSKEIPELKRFENASGLIGELKEAEIAAYKTMENQALNCLAAVKIVKFSPAMAQNPKEIGDNPFLTDIGLKIGPLPPERVSTIGTVSEYYQKLSVLTQANKLYDYSPAEYQRYEKNLAEQEQTEVDLKSAKKDKKKIAGSMPSDGLGYFTVEQIADNLSAEWLSQLAFDSTAMADAALTLLTVNDRSENVKKCRDQLASNWIDANGQPIIVGWGDFSELHPDNCFRIRDIYKEIEAHKYPRFSASPTASLTPKWSELITGLKKTAIAKQIQPNIVEVSRFNLQSQPLSCNYLPQKILLPDDSDSL